MDNGTGRFRDNVPPPSRFSSPPCHAYRRVPRSSTSRDLSIFIARTILEMLFRSRHFPRTAGRNSGKEFRPLQIPDRRNNYARISRGLRKKFKRFAGREASTGRRIFLEECPSEGGGEDGPVYGVEMMMGTRPKDRRDGTIEIDQGSVRKTHPPTRPRLVNGIVNSTRAFIEIFPERVDS